MLLVQPVWSLIVINVITVIVVEWDPLDSIHVTYELLSSFPPIVYLVT